MAFREYDVFVEVIPERNRGRRARGNDARHRSHRAQRLVREPPDRAILGVP